MWKGLLTYWRSVWCVCLSFPLKLEAPMWAWRMHALEWRRVWVMLGVCVWVHKCTKALDWSTGMMSVCVCGGECVCEEGLWVTLGSCPLSYWRRASMLTNWAMSLDWQGIHLPIVGLGTYYLYLSVGGLEPQHWSHCRGHYPISVGGQESFFYHSHGGKV